MMGFGFNRAGIDKISRHTGFYNDQAISEDFDGRCVELGFV